MSEQERSEREWIARPRGVLGQRELSLLTELLRNLPAPIRVVHIDGRLVTHIDFRGVPEFAEELRRLRRRGRKVYCHGFDGYLLAILEFALANDCACDLIATCFVRHAAGMPELLDEDPADRLIRELSPLGISVN